MKPVIALFFFVFSTAAMAQETQDLESYLWKKRPIVIFANSQDDPRFALQMEYLAANKQELDERDVVILTDTDPTVLSELRRKLRPRDFMVVLIGKDGAVKLRKPHPWTVREFSHAIDKMPMRQQEMGLR